jgi:hypothetical protein
VNLRCFYRKGFIEYLPFSPSKLPNLHDFGQVNFDGPANHFGSGFFDSGPWEIMMDAVDPGGIHLATALRMASI